MGEILEEFITQRTREELLSINWGQTNIALSTRLGLTPGRVGQLRLALRRKGYPIPKARQGPRGGFPRVRERYLRAGLGEVPDCVIAERLGVTNQAAHSMRVAMGIPAWRTRHHG